MIDVSRIKENNMYIDTDSFKPVYKLGHDELLCLKNMLMFYNITIVSYDDRTNEESRAVACSMIKEFLGFCYLKNQISSDDLNYIHSMDILSSRAGHKAFYDILVRKYFNVG